MSWVEYSQDVPGRANTSLDLLQLSTQFEHNYDENSHNTFID